MNIWGLSLRSKGWSILQKNLKQSTFCHEFLTGWSKWLSLFQILPEQAISVYN